MTGLLHEKEFSRKAFVKGGGALIVGLSLAGAGLAGNAKAADGLLVGTRPRFAGDQSQPFECFSVLSVFVSTIPVIRWKRI